jgi:PAS domain S-box-containing protein
MFRERGVDVQKLNAELEAQVALRTAELSEAVNSLENEIAERRRAESALRDSEARLRALLESAPQGIVAVDADGEIVLINARTEEMFGYLREELVGQKIECLLPERLAEGHLQHRRNFNANPRTRIMGAGSELAARRKDGREFPVEVSLSFIEEGGLTLASITDLTARKQFEDTLLQTQKLESLGVLAGGVAHDFNNLLTGILGNVSLAIGYLPDTSPIVPMLRQAVDASEKAAELTRQMLAYAGKGAFVIEDVNLSALVTETTRLIRTSIPKSVDLMFHLSTTPPNFRADKSQMRQIIMNLIINAAEALGEHPGLVTVSTGTRLVDNKFIAKMKLPVGTPHGKFACLEVQDNGCGMDETTKSRMFDPFFTTKFTGRGLGLAAVQGIVRAHRGLLVVKSDVGRGTSFEVLFPAGTDPLLPQKISTSANDGNAASKKAIILVVDDEESVRRIAKLVLEERGYAVRLAGNGRDALEHVFQDESEEITLVLLDLIMPVMGGEEALSHIKRVRPDVPIIISSGYNAEESIRKFPEGSVAGFLQKPYTADALATVIQSGCSVARVVRRADA